MTAGTAVPGSAGYGESETLTSLCVPDSKPFAAAPQLRYPLRSGTGRTREVRRAHASWPAARRFGAYLCGSHRAKKMN